MSKDLHSKPKNISNPIDLDFQILRDVYYKDIKTDLLLQMKKDYETKLDAESPKTLNEILNDNDEWGYQDRFIESLDELLDSRFLDQIHTNWFNDVAIGSYALDAIAAKRIRNVLKKNPSLTAEYELDVTAHFVDSSVTLTHTTPIRAYMSEAQILSEVQANMNYLHPELRTQNKDIEIINALNVVKYWNKAPQPKTIMLDTPTRPYMIDYFRLKNNGRYLMKNILYLMMEEKDTTAYDRISTLSVVPGDKFYDTIDDWTQLYGSVDTAEYKPEAPHFEDNKKAPKMIGLARRDFGNIDAVTEQASQAVEMKRYMDRFYKGKIPDEIYKDLKNKILAMAIIKGQTTSRMETMIQIPIWHEYYKNEIPHSKFEELRKADLEKFKKRSYSFSNSGKLYFMQTPENRIFNHLYDKFTEAVGITNIVRFA